MLALGFSLGVRLVGCLHIGDPASCVLGGVEAAIADHEHLEVVELGADHVGEVQSHHAA